ncbi:NAD(P)-dependent oxidoreductase [Cryptosporangium aurantiacum]|uniref:D-3-phosphoglycerate dehydrogenase n=1 Tax=Cryptosporangium aurantiacum TaxID=134849 RepID=A0A1M7PUU0_9ACTN|nr:NAD(P)-dependent oxidoreductase [Cryptosporangium aurantiacum]SHN21266.1 D-3-phosphoglycerate dehydrogenase [Cryptosporangium aurantiacum]
MSAPVVVLADPFGSVQDVRAGLGPVQAEVRAADAIPAGSGVVALLVGPETPLTEAHLDALPDLRIVAATSAGTDHIPVDAVTARGAWVTSTAGYCTDEVADHTIALVLNLLRGVGTLDAAVRAGRWDVREAAPRRIAGSVLGVVGVGATGQAVAQRATALGMRVLTYPGQDLHELLAEVDVVSLHVSQRPGAPPVLDAAAIAHLRPGAYVVNTARGGVLDTTALGDALRSGRIAGAALDVLPIEPPPADDPVRTFPRTILTPHAAWYSAEAAVRPYVWAGAAVAAVLAGREPDRVVGRP